MNDKNYKLKVLEDKIAKDFWLKNKKASEEQQRKKDYKRE